MCNVIVISLKEASERRLFQKKQLEKLGLSYVFLDAISSNTVSDKLIKNHYYDWLRPLTKPEMACFFSHSCAWQKVIDDDKPYLILEDDALLSKRLKSIFNKLLCFDKADHISLENRGRKKFVSRFNEKVESKVYLYNLLQDRTGAACYMLWPSGAKKLINYQNSNGIALADAHITSCSKLKSFQVEPAQCIQLDHCNLYNIRNEYTKLGKSTVSKAENYSGNYIFRIKRMFSEIKMAIHILRISLTSQRRYIKINKSDFS